MQRTILASAMAGLLISGTAMGQGSSIPVELHHSYDRFKVVLHICGGVNAHCDKAYAGLADANMTAAGKR